MRDSTTYGRPARRPSPKGLFSTLSDGRAAGGGLESSTAFGAPQSPSSELREYVCAVGDEEKPSQASGALRGAVHTLEAPSGAEQEGHIGTVRDMPAVIKKILRAAMALGVYVGLSILTVFWTKHLVGGRMPTPLFLSWMQQAVGLLVHVIMSVLISVACSQRSACGRVLGKAIPVVRVRGEVMLRVLPLSLCFVGMIGAANLCLQRVQVSVYQVARSLTLVFSLLLSVVWLKQRVLRGEVFSCLLVASGFALMTAVGSDAASISGYVMGGLASLFQAMYTVQMKATLISIQKDAEDQMTSRKRRSAYQPISGDSAEGSPERGTGVEGEGSKLTLTNRDVEALQKCSSSAVPSLDADALEEASPIERLTFEQGNMSMTTKQTFKLEDPLAVDSKAAAEEKTSPTFEPLELEEARERGSARGANAGNEGTQSAPRAEPICMFYNMLNALCLFPFVILLSDEPRVLWKMAADGLVFNSTVLSQIIGIGVITFALGSSIFWTVSLTSPLSFSVAGYVKTLLQVAVAMTLWGERLSLVETCGFLLTLSGSLWYSLSRFTAG
ncbi:hypothetical protein Esti_005908 [Eimeria stiedai]